MTKLWRALKYPKAKNSPLTSFGKVRILPTSAISTKTSCATAAFHETLNGWIPSLVCTFRRQHRLELTEKLQDMFSTLCTVTDPPCQMQGYTGYETVATLLCQSSPILSTRLQSCSPVWVDRAQSADQLDRKSKRHVQCAIFRVLCWPFTH